MVISPEFRMEQYRDDHHQEDALHFTKSFPNPEYCSFIEIMADDS